MDFFSRPKTMREGIAKGGIVGMVASRFLFPKVKEMPTNSYDINKATENNNCAIILMFTCAAVGALWGQGNAAQREGEPRPYIAAVILAGALMATLSLVHAEQAYNVPQELDLKDYEFKIEYN